MILTFQFYGTEQMNKESTVTMTNIVSEVLQDVTKEEVEHIVKPPPDGPEDNNVTDEVTKPADASTEKRDKTYTCCALKCDECFSSPDDLR